MKKILIPIIILFLLCTVRINAQTSPIAQLNQQNLPILNDNIQLLSNSIKSVSGLFSQYFTNGFLNTAHGGTGVDSSAWASGDTVVMVGIGIFGHQPSTSNLHGIQFFTSSGSFISPVTGVVYVTEIGAGAGGGGGVADTGGGGGGGQAIINFPYPVTATNTYTITVGIGGIGGTNASPDGSAGSDGGNTSFSSLIANGGKGGNPGAIGTGGLGGQNIPLGVSGQNGTNNGPGGGTFFGIPDSGSYGVGGDGEQGGSGAPGPSGSNGFVEIQY